MREPFESYFQKKIENMEAADLAMAEVPEEAVLYRDKNGCSSKSRDYVTHGREN